MLQFTSSFRGTRALFMQLLRSNVQPEQRPEIFKALVCIAYLVSQHSTTTSLSTTSAACSTLFLA